MLHHAAHIPLELIRTWGYVILFVASFLESTPFLGLLSPGGTISHLGGFFAHQGVLNVATVLGMVFSGLFLGDLVAYSLGLRFGYSFLIRTAKIFSVEESRIERVKKFVHDHTGKALTMGRVIFPVRVFAPFLAGAAGCKPPRFIFFSLLGTSIWALLTVYLGFVFGYGFDAVAAKVGRIFLAALVLGALLIFGFRSLAKLYKVVHRFEVYAFSALIVSLFLLGKLIEDLVSKTLFAQVDATVYYYTALPAFHTHFLDIVFSTATFLFNSTSVVVLTLLLCTVLLLKRLRVEAALVLSTTVLTYLLTAVIKEVLMLPRPPGAEALMKSFSYGFPSGHTSAATVFFLLIAYILSRRLKKPWESTWVLIMAIIAITLVGLSRMYLEVHWFSDVLGGIAVGVLSVSTMALLFEFGIQVYRQLREVWKNRRSL